MDIFKMIFGRNKVVPDVDPQPPTSKLELAFGRDGADTLLRELQEAKDVEDAGDYERGQVLAKAALAKAAEAAKKQTEAISSKT